MPTGINAPFSFTTRDYYDNNGDTNAAYGSELSWQQLDTTLLFLSKSISGIPTSVASVITSPSASIPYPPSTGEGTVYVVASDPDPNKDGTSYIYDADTTSWYPFQLQVPLPFVRIFSSSLQSITSSLLISGSGVTFSSSLFLSCASSLNVSTGYTMMLGADGKIYITGSYGGGGGGGGGTNEIKAGSIAPSSFINNPKTASVTFISAMADTDYGVSVIGGDARSWTIDNKTTSGFIINTNSTVALTTSASWIAAPSNNS